eukprot:g24964.t1
MGEELCTIAITKEVASDKLMGLKADKAPGPDGLYPWILTEVATEIVEGLVVIFQKLLNSREVPEDWKTANVTPLFKKGGRQK